MLLVAAIALLGAVPAHVQTSDYWGGYAGTHNVPAQQAAQWLTWAEVDAEGANELAPLGVKTIFYTSPTRVIPGKPMYTDDESEFAHTCGGARIASTWRGNQYLTNPRSPVLLSAWREYVKRHFDAAHFDAVFVDNAAPVYTTAQPCGFDLDDWLNAEVQAQRDLGYPVIYNALSATNGSSVSAEMTLNRSAIGGMMEECYSRLRPKTKSTGAQWWVTERTELLMAQSHKYFFCYGRDLTPADQAYDARVYTYASFLLTYDPSTSVLWEYYQTPSGGHVMPESALVALDPVKHVSRIEQLRDGNGIFVREYRRCYVRGKPLGGCAAAVNSDDDSHSLDLRGYHHTLVLHGSGVFDGGSISEDGALPSRLAPASAVIAFK